MLVFDLVSIKREHIAAQVDGLLKLLLEDLVASVGWELDIVQASVDTRALLIRWDSAEDVIRDPVDRDLVLKTAESTFRKTFAPSQPLDKLRTEIRLHLDNESQEIVIALTLGVESMIGFDRFL